MSDGAPELTERTIRRAGPRGRPRRWWLGAALLLLLSACGTYGPDQQPELEAAALDLPVNEALRVRFLPPIAKGSPQGDFVSGLDLEIQVFNVDPATGRASGDPLGPTLSTAGGTVTSNREVYRAIWRPLRVGEEGATEYLRLEIRLPDGGSGPVCNDPAGHCLGYLDIQTFAGPGGGPPSAPPGFMPAPVGALPLRFKVLESTGGPPPATLGELTALSGERFDEQLGNCASSFLTRPSQGLQAVGAGLQAVGAVGGLFQGATADLSGTLLTTGALASELRDELAPGGSGRNVVLFIVDDFGNGYELPAALFEADPDLEALADQISHGALVLHHLLELGSSLVPEVGWERGQGPDGQPQYYLTDGHGNRLYLQVVDVGELDTDVIPDRIRAAMLYYGGHGKHASSMVVNMSFAVVPCAVLHDFTAAEELVTFEAYLAALAANNDVAPQYLGELDELVSTPVDLGDDPLLSFVACPLPSDEGARCDGGHGSHRGVIKSLYQVASAGNYGNAYALYPAASGFVISVGSLAATGGGYAVADYSNSAEIAAPGGLFELASVGGSTVAYAGTSFAAPVVSLFLAVDGMQADPRCQAGDLNDRQPPALAYGAYDMLPFHGSGGALSAYCPNAS